MEEATAFPKSFPRAGCCLGAPVSSGTFRVCFPKTHPSFSARRLPGLPKMPRVLESPFPAPFGIFSTREDGIVLIPRRATALCVLA